jgi:hypothetical protein
LLTGVYWWNKIKAVGKIFHRKRTERSECEPIGIQHPCVGDR